MACMNLAIAYQNRIAGEKRDNVEEAIAYYEQALTVYTKAASPHDWAMTCMNLAVACQNRIGGAESDNVEEAIAYYEQALTV